MLAQALVPDRWRAALLAGLVAAAWRPPGGAYGLSSSPGAASPLLPARVRSALDLCYPRSAYGTRREVSYDAALAATDRFTPEGIPLAGDHMTYGEFDLTFFARLLRRAGPAPRDCFVDVGSGAGRLVLAAALLHPRTWRNCHGVELSAPLHDLAIAARYRFEENFGTGTGEAPGASAPGALAPRAWPHLEIAPCQYTLSDCMGGEEGLAALREADVAFSYAVTWAHGDAHDRLVRTLARELPDGARVISINLPLRNEVLAADPAEEDGAGTAGTGAGAGAGPGPGPGPGRAFGRFELLGREVGENRETGKDTVGLVYRLVR